MNPLHTEWKQNEFLVSTDPTKLDVAAIHAFLSHAYWCEGIPREIVERALQNSLCFGLFDDGKQVGFARVVTDCATFAYLCDVYVLESHRDLGLGNWLMECVMAHPQLQVFGDSISLRATRTSFMHLSVSNHSPRRSDTWKSRYRTFIAGLTTDAANLRFTFAQLRPH